MRIKRLHILFGFLILITCVGFFAHQSHAQSNPFFLGDTAVTSYFTTKNEVVSYVSGATVDGINNILATIVNSVLGATAILVAIAGTLLDVSINLTLNIRDFVNSIPAIYVIWRTIRDISGIFFIFFLLYAAMRMILSLDSGYEKLIKEIVIAGLLINFSFFMTGVAIDASNIVSKTIYSAMVENPLPPINDAATLEKVTATLLNKNAAALSSKFMNSLKIQKLYDYNAGGNQQAVDAIGDPVKIFFIGVMGVIIMIVAAFSFGLAAIAFVFRFIALLFLLAFSPLWVAALVIPQLSSFGKKYLDHLKSQLLFMPVYLLLMYAALQIVQGSNLVGAGSSDLIRTATGPGSTWWYGYVIMAINFAIVIFMLNIPLLVAIEMGGKATSWIDMKKFGADAIFRRVGRNMVRDTAGRAASKLADTNSVRDWASLKGPVGSVGRLALKGMRGTASDYNKKLDTQVSDRVSFGQSLGFNEKKMTQAQSVLRSFQNQLAAAKARNASPSVIDTLDDQIKKAKSDISTIENARRVSYKKDLESMGPFVSLQTLYTKVARKDKVAAAKLQIPVLEDRLKKQKEDLQETQKDLKDLDKAIKNSTDGNPNAEQFAERTKILRTISKQTDSTNKTQSEIDALKLIK